MSSVTMGPAQPLLPSHFETKPQHNETNILGMWLFIAQEIMFFGGLFTAYAVYRMRYPDAWAAGAAELDVTMGAINTFVLLVSSLTMAMSVYFTQTDRYRALLVSYATTIFLGGVFLFIKYLEYGAKFDHHLVPGLDWDPHLKYTIADPRPVKLYFVLYFTMTGMHAFHMIIGIVLGGIIWVMAFMKKFGPNRHMPIEIFGFYWHFVDIVWVFLFPMIYLIPPPGS